MTTSHSANRPSARTTEAESQAPQRGKLPTSVSLCQDPLCALEFYMPDAAEGERCPMEHLDRAPVMVRYVPASVAEELAEALRPFAELSENGSPDAVLASIDGELRSAYYKIVKWDSLSHPVPEGSG